MYFFKGRTVHEGRLLESDSVLAFARPRPVLNIPRRRSFTNINIDPSWDDRRFLVAVGTEHLPIRDLLLVAGWLAEIDRRKGEARK